MEEGKGPPTHALAPQSLLTKKTCTQKEHWAQESVSTGVSPVVLADGCSAGSITVAMASCPAVDKPHTEVLPLRAGTLCPMARGLSPSLDGLQGTLMD